MFSGPGGEGLIYILFIISGGTLVPVLVGLFIWMLMTRKEQQF